MSNPVGINAETGGKGLVGGEASICTACSVSSQLEKKTDE
jgi:hypothetical protein